MAKKFYRIITVDGVVYEYKVGRRHVKIKGIGNIPSGEVGVEYEDDKFEVIPAQVAYYIQNGESRINVAKREMHG